MGCWCVCVGGGGGGEGTLTGNLECFSELASHGNYDKLCGTLLAGKQADSNVL